VLYFFCFLWLDSLRDLGGVQTGWTFGLLRLLLIVFETKSLGIRTRNFTGSPFGAGHFCSSFTDCLSSVRSEGTYLML
ncbi:hypothetical protein B296_00012743, partial [Ensete ventricosum]